MQPNGEFFLSDGSYAVTRACAIIGLVCCSAFIWLPALMYIGAVIIEAVKKVIAWISTKK